MRLCCRRTFVALAFCIAAPIIIGAESTTDSARSEVRLQLAELLYGDQRYWEALSAYENAKQGARPDQLLRASSGLLKSLLHIAEFTRAQQEADFLYSLDRSIPITGPCTRMRCGRSVFSLKRSRCTWMSFPRIRTTLWRATGSVVVLRREGAWKMGS